MQDREGLKQNATVHRWEDCSRLCRQRVGCRYWTWYNRYSGDSALNCVTMIDANVETKYPGAISGERYCGSKTTVPNGPQLQCPSMSQILRGEGRLAGSVSNWRECAQLCTETENCGFWSWFDQKMSIGGTNINKDDCYTYPSAHGIEERNGVISGDISCPHKGVKISIFGCESSYNKS